MRQYFFILADAELELVPERIRREGCVLNSARARSKSPDRMLLDASHHHPAFRKLPDGERRGRPDIAHFFLLLAMDSDVNAVGRLRVFVHTRNDDVIAVNPETRLPPNYIRFVGLIEQLFEQQVVPSRENALLELRQGVPLVTLVQALKPDDVIILDPMGPAEPVQGAFDSSVGERVVVIIGGFSRGGYKTDMRPLKNARRISIGERMMKVWTVASKTLRAAENAFDVPVEEPGEMAVEAPAKKTTKKATKKTTKKAAKKPAKAPSGSRPSRKKKAE